MSGEDERGATQEGARLIDTGVMQFSVDKSGDSVLITLLGELDLASTAELTAAFDEVVGGEKDIVVEMAGLTFIDSTGMAVLVRARRSAEQAGRSVTLRRVQPNVAKTLALAGLDKVFGTAD